MFFLLRSDDKNHFLAHPLAFPTTSLPAVQPLFIAADAHRRIEEFA